MSYSQDKGIITRGIIVEMCRTGATGIELASALGLSIQQVRKQCQRLKDERYITYAYDLGKTHLYQKQPLRKMEFGGIGSTFSMMDN